MTDVAPAYRLVKARHADAAFHGEGARRFGGLWNSKGRPCVYVASSESLATLEVLVHLGQRQPLRGYALFHVRIPAASILYLDAAALPANWRDPLPPAETAEIGDAWLTGAQSLALAVPSVVVPREVNYMLNPGHPEFAKVVTGAERGPFAFDERLQGQAPR